MHRASSISNVYILLLPVLVVWFIKTVSLGRPPVKMHHAVVQALDGWTLFWELLQTGSDAAGNGSQGVAVIRAHNLRARKGAGRRWVHGERALHWTTKTSIAHQSLSELMGRAHRLQGLSALPGDARSGDTDHRDDSCENGPPCTHEG